MLLDGLSGPARSVTFGFLDGFFSPVKQVVEVADLEKPIVVHRMPVFQDLAGTSPVPERTTTNTEILGGLGDPQVFVQFGHRWCWPGSGAGSDGRVL